MIWNDHSRDIPNGSHAFLSPSTYSWAGYNDEKLMETYINKLAVARGTAMHDLACRLIKMKVRLPKNKNTLNLYVNDAITYKMDPERKLYYSKFCYGTADAIGLKDSLLRISDLKTGKTKASFEQLLLYAALFFLEYRQYKPSDLKVELRIYQNDEVRIEEPETDDIVPRMDKIVRFDRILTELEERYDEGFDSYRSWT